MDRITPLDLERLELPVRMRGYDRSAVRGCLKQAADEIGALLTELHSARSELASVRSELERYNAQDALIKEALILAQKAADETRANAHREAELIREEASRHAAGAREAAEAQISDLRWELDRLKNEHAKTAARIRSMLQEQLIQLEAQRLPETSLVNLEVSSSAVG